MILIIYFLRFLLKFFSSTNIARNDFFLVLQVSHFYKPFQSQMYSNFTEGWTRNFF